MRTLPAYGNAVVPVLQIAPLERRTHPSSFP
jgi:hypothetical protein